jgi:hypothetical protein
MADTMELARAYITIVPSMEGSRQTITEELGGAADEAGSVAGSRAGAAFSGALGAAARVGAAAVSAAAQLLGGPDNCGTRLWWDKNPNF